MTDNSWTAEREDRVRSSFARQGLMATLGATLEKVEPGRVEVALTPAPAITQQHGFVHAGAVSAIADSAAGYATMSLLPLDTSVLTTEFKINLIAPATGDRIVARGEVVKAGRTLTIAQTRVVAVTGSTEKLVALLVATMMAIRDREDVSE
ncbi:MAG: PaaI family thioesterase [Xanthobacteraceae bacterium]